jgi:hypothetical protein
MTLYSFRDIIWHELRFPISFQSVELGAPAPFGELPKLRLTFGDLNQAYGKAIDIDLRNVKSESIGVRKVGTYGDDSCLHWVLIFA